MRPSRQVVFLLLAALAVGGLPSALLGAEKRVRCVETSLSRTVLSLEVDSPSLAYRDEGGTVCTRVLYPGAGLLKRRDYPELPFFQARVVVPPEGEVELRVIRLESRELACPPPIPSRGFASRSAPLPPRRFGAYYQTGGLFPEHPAALGPEARIRDVRTVLVNLYPFQYDAGGRHLRICTRLAVEVRVGAGGKAGKGGGAPAVRMSKEFGRLLAGQVANPTVLAGLGDAAAAAKSPELPSESGSLLIIAADALVPGVVDLAVWKRQRGLSVEVARYPADTGSLPNGPTALAAYVANRYQAAGIDFVILVGDSDTLPCRSLTDSGDTIPSDTVLSLTSGSDMYHDLYLSRVSATTATEVARQLQRFVTYERNPLAAGDAGWLSRGLCVASAEGKTTSAFGLMDKEQLAEEAVKWRAAGFANVQELYDPGVTDTSVVEAFNSGLGLVYYLGHGVDTNWRTSGFDVADVGRLANGWRQPFVVNGACHVGNFTRAGGDCLCEALMKAGTSAAPAGPVSTLGATTAMDWDPPIVMEEAMTELVTAGPVTTLGGITFGAVQAAMDYCYATADEGEDAAVRIMEQTHLFGDCSLEYRWQAPLTLTVTHDALLVPMAGFHVQAVAAGLPLADAVVTLYRAGVLASAVTDGDGQAVFSLDVAAGGPVTLTVYHRTVVPVQASVPVADDRLRIYSTASLPTGFVGEAYAFTCRVSGGQAPYSWSLGEPLAAPAWLQVGTTTGTISGVPAAAGTYTFTVEVTDAVGNGPVSQELTLTAGQAVALVTDSLPAGRVGDDYAAAVVVAGSFAPFDFTVTGGTLPPGLSLSAAGQLAGEPTEAGEYSFTVGVRDAELRSDSRTFAVRVRAAESVLILTSTELPTGDRLAAYQQTLAATGGTGRGFAWSVVAGGLPPGLSLSASGLLTGTPTAAGHWSFTLRVTDDDAPPHTAERAFALLVNSPVYFTASSLPKATAGVPYTAPVPVAGTYTPVELSVVTDTRYQREEGQAGFAATGTRQTWLADEQEWPLDLGFAFPFGTATYTSVRVGDDGYLVLGDQASPDPMWDANGTALAAHSLIAPFWNDLAIDGSLADTGIWVARESGAITVLWRGREYDHPAWTLEFSATLAADGTILFRYGGIRTTNRVVVGISDGAGMVDLVYSQPKYSSAPAALWSAHNDVIFHRLEPLPAWLTLSSAGNLTGTAPTAGASRFTLLATDNRGYSARQDFQLTVDGPVGVVLALAAGWNCVSVPVEPVTPDPASVFGVAGAVWAWDAVAQSYTAATRVAAKAGYWVYVPEARACTVTGAEPTAAAVSLVAGWNLIGALVSLPLPVRDSLVAPAWSWQADQYHPATSLEPGLGYWLRATAADVLNLRGE